MRTETLDVPGAELHNDVREPDRPSAAPPLLLIGSPMGAAGFGTLAGHFPDRTVVTYDPRGLVSSTQYEPDVDALRAAPTGSSSPSEPGPRARWRAAAARRSRSASGRTP
jgi:hypothetical protein